VLGGYLARETLRSPAAPPSAHTGTGPTGMTTAPETPPGTPQPAAPEPTKLTPSPEPTDRDEAPPEVLIIPTDYWGRRGSDAIVTAKAHGLIPRVVDDDGELVDPDLRSQCRIVRVTPLSGFVPRGSTLELTCRGGR
jgi:hypothetical protein